MSSLHARAFALITTTLTSALVVSCASAEPDEWWSRMSQGARAGVAGPVGGVVDAVVWERNQLHVRGWACDRTVASSIAVHVYVGGAAGAGQLIGGYTANRPREVEVSRICATSGVAHGFDIAIPHAQIAAHAGRAVFVHGISTSNGDNRLLSESGRYVVPPAPAVNEVLLSERVRGLSPTADLLVDAGETVVIDQSIDVGVITVAGTLRCPTSGEFTITAAGISVVGTGAVFECGAESRRFNGKLTIALEGGRDLPHVGERALVAMEGGALRLFGQAKNHRWLRIGAPVSAGTNVVQLDGVVDWSRGDRIAIGSTSFNYAESEERTIESVSSDGMRSTVTVSEPFRFAHNNFAQTYTQGANSWRLDERAEVANLTRNIVITAAGEPAALDAGLIGAHVMVTHSGSAQVDGVEFTRVGQLGRMGRYPFHWHLVGDASGQFIRNSSIHRSYQRCVTIHGTHRARVENNVCFEHYGHGYFFEQGNEVDNVMTGNLGMRSLRAPNDRGLLVSDSVSTDPARFSAPAAFWVTNPRNTITDNVASGSQGTGFWMAFNQELLCATNESCTVVAADNRCRVVRADNTCADADPSRLVANTFPARADTTAFARNVAHASEVGITWDGAEDELKYDAFRAGSPVGDPLPGLQTRNPSARVTVSTHYHHGAAVPSFDDLVVFKNVASGVYFRGNSARFPRLIAADNGFSLFFAYNQIVTDGLVVGASAGLTAEDLAYTHTLPAPMPIATLQGARIYDGPFELDRVHFADFRSIAVGAMTVRAWPFMNIGGANRFINRVRGVSFENVGTLMALGGANGTFNDIGWFDTPWTTAVRDVDGTLSGNGGRILVPNHPMNITADCVRLAPNVGDGYACSYEWGVLALFESDLPAPHNANSFPFTVDRVDERTGAVVEAPRAGNGALHNKAGLIAGSQFRYRLGSPVLPTVLRIRWQHERGLVSPLIEIAGANTCRPNGLPMVSVEALRAGSSGGYAVSGASLFFKLPSEVYQFTCG